MQWPWQRPRQAEPTSELISISDPVLAAYFGMSPTYAGVQVGEGSALGISAFFRALSLISGTIAGLPLKVYRDTAEGERKRLESWLDDPGGLDGQTPY